MQVVILKTGIFGLGLGLVSDHLNDRSHLTHSESSGILEIIWTPYLMLVVSVQMIPMAQCRQNDLKLQSKPLEM